MHPEKFDSGSRLFEVGNSSAATDLPRLDVFLGRELEISRTEARRLLADGLVQIDGRKASLRDKGRILRAGSQVHVAEFQTGAAQRIVPEPEAELCVLAQGPGWVACSKPAEMAVHPLNAAERGTLAAAVVARFPAMQGVGEGGLRSGVLHRLDLATSGVVLFATEPTTWQRLRRAFTAHRITKHYLALVWGRLEGKGREEHCLKVAQHHPARVRVVANEAADASGVRKTRLAWKVVENFCDVTLLEIALETGFLHQIRAVFSHRGYPLVGDSTYGLADRDREFGVSRLMLHAAEIRFEEIAGVCPEPVEFRETIERFRKSKQNSVET